MENQKLENILNLSLEITREERQKSPMLKTGYDLEKGTWEVIVKYSGTLMELEKMGIGVEEMRNEYAILTIPESQIDLVSQFTQIEYIEKPKRLFFAWNQAKTASFIPLEQTIPYGLTGENVLVGILDSGIDAMHPAFQNPDGSSKIILLWDQDSNKIYTKDTITDAPRDVSGHGTAVAGIISNIATKSNLCVVRLGTSKQNGFPRTTELMRGLDFLVNQSVILGKPMAINISIGNTYGGHDGTSLLETFINDISNYGKISMIVGSGNEGSSGGHTSGKLLSGVEKIVEFIIAPFETNINLQLWKLYQDEFQMELQAPDGSIIGRLSKKIGIQRFQFRNTKILVYYGMPSPYSQAQEIFFDFIPINDYITSGIWKIRIIPEEIVVGQYDFWLPASNILNEFSQFANPTPDTTLTIPSTSSHAITVGAYNDKTGSYAPFSGRGFTRLLGQVKPDLVAPGVNIIAPALGGGYTQVTGTSFAAPMVTGNVALLMEWGIVQGKDPFLYGEKMKACLIRGTKQLQGFQNYPNESIGWGKLDLLNTLVKKKD